MQAPEWVDVFLDIVPLNPIDSMSKGNMLQVIFFAMIFGFGLSAVGERGKTVLSFFEGCAEVMIKVTNMVMVYAPFGVFGLIAFTVASHGVAVLLPLIKVIGVMYLACVCHVFVCYLPLVKACGLSIPLFFKMLAAPMIISFTTCSSAAALSTNLIQVQKLGASKPVASFSIPLGNTINMDGTAVYMGVVAIFVAELYGIPMPFDKQFEVILVGVLASIGTVGVPGAGPAHELHRVHPGGHSAGRHRHHRRHRPRDGHGPHLRQRARRRHRRHRGLPLGRRIQPRSRSPLRRRRRRLVLLFPTPSQEGAACRPLFLRPPRGAAPDHPAKKSPEMPLISVRRPCAFPAKCRRAVPS